MSELQHQLERETEGERREARKVLTERAARVSHGFDPRLLGDHLLRLFPDASFELLESGMEALLRRARSARREELRIAKRPPRGELLGDYLTRRKGQGARPYRSRVRAVKPFEGTCSCLDYQRSSLAVCKHLLAIWNEVEQKPRLLERAIEKQGEAVPALRWDPVRPEAGSGDWMERLTLAPEVADERATRALRGLMRRRFDARNRLAETFAEDPDQRLRLVNDLMRLNEGLSEGEPDPAIEALLEREKESLARLRSCRVTPGGVDTALKSLGQRLFPYQREGLAAFFRTGHLLLGDDMGLGKTAQAIAACHVLWKTRRVRKGLIVVPASLKSQWLREWRRFTDVPAEIIDGFPAERAAIYERTERGFLITNYEQLLRDEDVVRAFEPEAMVLDEAQRIKNWETKTAQVVKAFRPPYRLVLTGTPLENRLEELASLFDWIEPTAFEPKWRLEQVRPARSDERQLRSLQGLQAIRERMAPHFLRRVRTEVLDQLPERTDTTITVDFTGRQHEEYEALCTPIRRLLCLAQKRPLLPPEHLRLMTLLAAQRRIGNGMALYEFVDVWPEIRDLPPTEARLARLDSPKLIELREMVRQLLSEPTRKLVIFSDWQRMVKLAEWSIRDLLQDIGASAVFFTGAQKGPQRERAMVTFHDDPSVRVLFATNAGGVGLNLQRAASDCINLELPWNPAVLEQRIGRVYRMGQKRPVQTFQLVSEGGLEPRIQELVGEKRRLFEALFEGTSDEVTFDHQAGFTQRLSQLDDYVPRKGDEATDDEADLDATAVTDGSDDSDTIPANGVPSATATRSASAPAQPPAAPDGLDVRQLFDGVRVSQTADGQVRLEAKPETARQLAGVLEGLAGLLRQIPGAD
ncbi:MAG: DEAD/DEAH box helicase [Planctomycetota bacterium]